MLMFIVDVCVEDIVCCFLFESVEIKFFDVVICKFVDGFVVNGVVIGVVVVLDEKKLIKVVLVKGLFVKVDIFEINFDELKVFLQMIIQFLLGELSIVWCDIGEVWLVVVQLCLESLGMKVCLCEIENLFYGLGNL